MNRFIPHWLRKPWIPTLIALVLLAILIWFWAPLLEAGAALRWMLIALLMTLAAAWFAARLWLARRRHRALMDGIAPPAPAASSAAESDPAAADLAALGQRMRAALAVLRTANPGWRMRGRYLYELPWYVFVGAPGSGKTTALTRSGLEFPLAETLGPEAIGGIGGTRHCDWWFTDEAVLLDTAGRYTTQDSQLEVDRAAWGGFLGLLRKHRPRRPINGVIVTISVADLLLQPRAAREAQARAVRARIQELQERLGLAFPVYVIVTKSDLLAGFTEFFEPLGREERAQVWGMTFSLADSAAPAPALAAFPAEFRALETQLQLRMLERLQQERDLGRRALIHGFPRQFAALEDALENFLQAVFSANRFEQPALLRGVYFTSGTQEGTPIERVMSSLAASFGLRDRALPPRPESGRSYFLTRLMRDVIFREAGLAGLNPRAERRRRLLQWGVLAGGAALALLLATALSISYVRNTRLVEESDAAVAALARQAAAAPLVGDELGVLPLLDAARALPAGYAQRERDVALLERMGLYQGEKLGDGAQAAYRRLLRTTLETRIVARMENVLRRGDAGGQDLLYETLRVYLMLGQRQHFEPAAVQAWVEFEWERSLAGAAAAERAQLAAHLEALLEQGDTPEPVQLDAALVEQARQALAGMSLSDRIYGVAKRQVMQEALPEFSVSRALGRDASGVLARASGEPLGRGVNGLYSVAGYRRFAQLSWLAVADIAGDDWVLARREANGGPEGVAAAREAVLQLYFADYIRAWDAFLGDLRLAPLASLDDAARVSNALGGADSALRVLLAGAARETALAAVKADGLPPGVGKLVQDKVGRARRQLEAVFGAQQAPPLQQQQQQHPVDSHFAPLHRLVKGPAPTQLEQMLALVRDAALYFDAAEGARRSGAPAPAQDALVRLKRAGEGQSAPLPAMFKGVHDAGAGLAQGGERARLNALWNAGPAQFCRDAIAGRYPLDRASARDATADDFGKFFAPGGLMDDFFTRHLATFVDMGGARWRWRAAGDLAGASQGALDAFQRGARLRDMFFAGGARQPTLRFTLRPLSADTALSGARLEIDGQQVAADGQAVSLLLPSGKGNGQVRLSAPGTQADLRSDGPWAWLRTVDRGVLEPLQPERYRLGLSLDGRKASWELTAGSVINPFRREVTGFGCPAAL
ncbi:type VI secretion system membrane subunit TssM [Massilia sp. CFBP9012]|uniref:type VI secretion system membrane subunit TssM n=1 Tax=Massilia sp. CFBP9012 TaxID=3096531 RepID=UPI002A6B4DFC|nr:type VI secretion system membrane subunit TssM [Massilia sp. CFBP9012]MDY0974779.1 type VI secretion system membrane subunit TssM [Massilia sp. CFBP9012]